MSLSKHITHYDPRSGFSYYNMTSTPPPQIDGLSLSITQRCAEQLYGLEPWEHSPLPSIVFSLD